MPNPLQYFMSPWGGDGQQLVSVNANLRCLARTRTICADPPPAGYQYPVDWYEFNGIAYDEPALQRAIANGVGPPPLNSPSPNPPSGLYVSAQFVQALSQLSFSFSTTLTWNGIHPVLNNTRFEDPSHFNCPITAAGDGSDWEIQTGKIYYAGIPDEYANKILTIKFAVFFQRAEVFDTACSLVLSSTMESIF